MNLRTNSKSSLFLIELMIVILFFAIAGAICASLFVQSRLMSVESTQLTMATQKCQNAAEAMAATAANPAATARLLDDALHHESLVTQGYDLEGNSDPQGRYQLQITFGRDEAAPSLNRSTIIMTDTVKDKVIYTLETANYIP